MHLSPPEAARAAVAWLTHGAELCLRGEVDALVTAPVNKESIIRSGEKISSARRNCSPRWRHGSHRHDVAGPR